LPTDSKTSSSCKLRSILGTFYAALKSIGNWAAIFRRQCHVESIGVIIRKTAIIMEIRGFSRNTMGKKEKYGILLLIVGTCLISGLSLHSSQTSQDAIRPQKPLRHEVSVTIKLVQVLVTDKKGNPVTDLHKEDFVLCDNGKEQKLTEFERHDLRLPTAEAMPADGRAIPTPITGASRLLNRKLFFLFDFAYTNPQGARKAVQESLHFIDTRLLPTDEVGVVSYSAMKRLQIHEFLTNDHRKIRRAVESFGLYSSLGSGESLGGEPGQESEFEEAAGGRIEAVSINPGSGT
jgi:hypothetical protein